jgi:hypothetical protein
VTEAQIKSAQAGVAQREAALAQARIDLARTRITSPVNGIVIKRAIEKGQTVAASLQSPELFVIAQNLQDMQVDASIDESDVGRIRTGQKATFTVDAFPGQTFEGTVRQVRKAAQNVANVVTYVAVVGFSNTGGRLLPGMTANVRVITDQRESVLKVPNARCGCALPVWSHRRARPRVPGTGTAPPAARARLVAGCLRRWPSRPVAVAGAVALPPCASAWSLRAEAQPPSSRQAGRDWPPTCGPSSWRCATCPRTSAPAAREKLLAEMRRRSAPCWTRAAQRLRACKPRRRHPAVHRVARSGWPGCYRFCRPARFRAGCSPKRRQSGCSRPNRTRPAPAPAPAAMVRPRSPGAQGATRTRRPGGAAAGSGRGRRGPLVETRNRLVAELRWTRPRPPSWTPSMAACARAS